MTGEPIHAPVKGNVPYDGHMPNQDVGITQKPISLHMKEGNMYREISL